jgi:hypothetical protein
MEVEIAQPCWSVWPAAESVMGIMVMLVSPAAAKLPMVRACPEGAVTVTLCSRFKSSGITIEVLQWRAQPRLAERGSRKSGHGAQDTQASLANRTNAGRGIPELRG